VNFPGTSTLLFSTSCGGSSVSNLTLGQSPNFDDNDTFTFDSPATITVTGGFLVNARGSGKIIIPFGVTVNVSGGFQLNPQSAGCESGNPCVFEIEVEGTLNVSGGLQNNLVMLVWSGLGTVDVDGAFENSTSGCMECSIPSCPAFPVGGGGCIDVGVGCSIDFCVDGNYGNPALPVELLFFTGESLEQHVLLKWATASEENFDFFNVQRSVDTQEYKNIGKVSGAGFSNVRIDYSFEDGDPVIGRSFYRLQSIDFDGYREYSEIISVVYDSRLVKAFTNSTGDDYSLNLIIRLLQYEQANITLYSSLGSEVFAGKFSSGTYKLPLVHLKAGVYVAKIQYPGMTKSMRLIVSR